jgi:hypothetical protein
LLSIVQAT